MKPPTVAVTGGTGFFGRHLVAGLVAAGWRVRALSRSGPLADPGIETIPGDLDDAEALEKLVRGADAVVHAAGAIKARRAVAFHAVNAEGTARLLERASAHAPDAHIVVVSSLAAREPQLSPYAASKREAEERARRLVTADRLLIVRPPALYGPFDRETLAVFRLAKLPLTPLAANGRERIALLHVADAATSVIDLLERRASGAFTLADNRPQGYGMREIFSEAGRAQGRRPRFAPVSPALLRTLGRGSAFFGDLLGRPSLLSPGKVREMLHEDWSVNPADMPQGLAERARTLTVGFSEAVAWYRKAGWL